MPGLQYMKYRLDTLKSGKLQSASTLVSFPTFDGLLVLHKNRLWDLQETGIQECHKISICLTSCSNMSTDSFFQGCP